MGTQTGTIVEWNVVDHGVKHARYFQGHGIALTDYTHTATGCGHDVRGALDAAIDVLAHQHDIDADWDELERAIRAEHPDFNDPGKVRAASVSAYHAWYASDPDACSDEHDDCEHHYYLSIDLRVA